MPVPVLLVVVGTRAEMLASASLIRTLRAADPLTLPFETRFVVTGQERTELDQTLDALGVEPDGDLSIKTPHLFDAALAARLLHEMEAALRHHNACCAVATGTSASAWATAVAAYHRQTPVIHLGAGAFAPAGRRPFPEWLHASDLARIAELHLCPDEESAQILRREIDGGARCLCSAGAAIRVVGHGSDEALARALADPPPGDDDPTLTGLRSGAPRVLVFIRRREHHADALRPLCRTLDALSRRFADHEFTVVYSLQSHICDAFAAQLPACANLRGVAPLPYPAFVREVARARLVVTDSAGVSREAALLSRPLVVVGAYSVVESALRHVPAGYTVAEVTAASLESAIMETLAQSSPSPAPSEIPATPTGRMAAQAIVEWWKGK